MWDLPTSVGVFELENEDAEDFVFQRPVPIGSGHISGAFYGLTSIQKDRI